MLAWTELATAVAPGGDRIRLWQRGHEFSIRLQGGNELMNSRLGGSEEALATLALEPLAPQPGLRVLIGGLGMGFTLRAALGLAPSDAQITVSEIVPDLVTWADRHMADVFGSSLADPRVTVRTGDVGVEIRAQAAAYDAILLDVDNGPGGLTRAGNDALYSEAGLRAARRALTPGGVLAVWSAAPDDSFTRRLSRSGFAARSQQVHAGRTARGPRHTIWIAQRS